MYLVMVASQGSLRNPVVIVLQSSAGADRGAGLACDHRTHPGPARDDGASLLLVGIVVTNAIVLIAFVEQLRTRGMSGKGGPDHRRAEYG